MAFKITEIDPEDLQRLNKDKVFPEVTERLELPENKLIQVMDKHIKRVYDNRGINGLNEYREEWTRKKDYAKELKDKPNLSDQTIQHLSGCVYYFDLFLQRSYHLENDLIRSNMKAGKGSNREKLDIAEGWIDDLVREISSINVTQYSSTQKANKEVVKILNKVYPGFIAEFDFTKLKTDFVSGGKLTKKSINIALKFIFEKKHKPETISRSAINKRIDRKELWN